MELSDDIEMNFMQMLMTSHLDGSNLTEPSDWNAAFSKMLLQNDKATHQDLLSQLGKLGPRKVCQYQFKTNDIVWICKNCQTDDTCVLCNTCFRNSDHTGHDVYFYHSAVGGCCDCGDAVAWKPAGFCAQHGVSHANPISFLPLDMHRNMTTMFTTFCSKFISFARRYQELSRSDASLPVNSDVDYYLYLYSDDKHTVEEICQAATATGGLQVRLTFSEITRALNQDGYVRLLDSSVAVDPDDPALSGLITLLRKARILKSNGYSVRCISHIEWRQYKALSACMDWLQSIALACDGICSLLCRRLEEAAEGEGKGEEGDALYGSLYSLFVLSFAFDKSLAKRFHNWLLALMSDHSFKTSAGIAYSRVYYALCMYYGQVGDGLQTQSLFHLSVQYLNRELIVHEICYHYGFLQESMRALLDLLSLPSAAALATTDIEGDGKGEQEQEEKARMKAWLTKFVIKKRSYSPIIGDLKVVFTIHDVSRYFQTSCHQDWLVFLTNFQMIHRQTRSIRAHVTHEEEELWLAAFNLSLGISNLYEYLCNWFMERNADEGQEGQGAEGGGKGQGVGGQPSFTSFATTMNAVIAAASNSSKQPASSHSSSSMVASSSGSSASSSAQAVAAPRAAKEQAIVLVKHITVTQLLSAIFAQCCHWQTTDPHQASYLQQETLIHSNDPRCLTRSFHLLLHRFLSFACSETFKFSHLLTTVTRALTPASTASIADQTLHNKHLYEVFITILQVVSFADEVNSGMWRRNGQSMIQQVINYEQQPYSKLHRDADLLLIQIVMQAATSTTVEAKQSQIDRLMLGLLHNYRLLGALTINPARYLTNHTTYNNTITLVLDTTGSPSATADVASTPSRSSMSTLSSMRDAILDSFLSLRTPRPLPSSTVGTIARPPPHAAAMATVAAMRAAEQDKEFLPSLLASLLQLFIQLVTELPLAPPSAAVPSAATTQAASQADSNSDSSMADVLQERLLPIFRREWIHQLMVHSLTFAALNESVTSYHEFSKMSAKSLNVLVNEIAVKQATSGGLHSLTAPSYSLKRELYSEYDPCYYHLTAQQHQQVQERKGKLTQPTAIVGPPPGSKLRLQSASSSSVAASSTVHPYFDDFRRKFLLTNAVLCELIYTLILDMICKKWKGTGAINAARSSKHAAFYQRQVAVDNLLGFENTITIFHRLLQLITLMIHQMKEEAAAAAGAAEIAEAMQQLFLYTHPGLLEQQKMIQQKMIQQILPSSFINPIPPSLLELLYDSFVLYDNDSNSGNSNSNSSSNNTNNSNEFYHLKWIFDELCCMFPATAATSEEGSSYSQILAQLGYPVPVSARNSNTVTTAMVVDSKPVISATTENSNKTKMIQSKAMSSVQQAAAQFMAMLDDLSDEEEDDNGKEKDVSNRSKQQQTQSSSLTAMQDVIEHHHAAAAAAADDDDDKIVPVAFTKEDGGLLTTADNDAEEEEEVCIVCLLPAASDEEELEALGPLCYLSLVQLSRVLHAEADNNSLSKPFQVPEIVDKPDPMKTKIRFSAFPLKSSLKQTRDHRNYKVSLCGHKMHQHCCETYVQQEKVKSNGNGHFHFDGNEHYFNCPLCKKLVNNVTPCLEVTLAAADIEAGKQHDQCQGKRVAHQQSLSTAGPSTIDHWLDRLQLLGQLYAAMPSVETVLGRSIITQTGQTINYQQALVTTVRAQVERQFFQDQFIIHPLTIVDHYLSMISYSFASDLAEHQIPGYHLPMIQAYQQQLQTLVQRQAQQQMQMQPSRYHAYKYSPGLDDMKTIDEAMKTLVQLAKAMDLMLYYPPSSITNKHATDEEVPDSTKVVYQSSIFHYQMLFTGELTMIPLDDPLLDDQDEEEKTEELEEARFLWRVIQTRNWLIPARRAPLPLLLCPLADLTILFLAYGCVSKQHGEYFEFRTAHGEADTEGEAADKSSQPIMMEKIDEEKVKVVIETIPEILQEVEDHSLQGVRWLCLVRLVQIIMDAIESAESKVADISKHDVADMQRESTGFYAIYYQLFDMVATSYKSAVKVTINKAAAYYAKPLYPSIMLAWICYLKVILHAACRLQGHNSIKADYLHSLQEQPDHFIQLLFSPVTEELLAKDLLDTAASVKEGNEQPQSKATSILTMYMQLIGLQNLLSSSTMQAKLIQLASIWCRRMVDYTETLQGGNVPASSSRQLLLSSEQLKQQQQQHRQEFYQKVHQAQEYGYLLPYGCIKEDEENEDDEVRYEDGDEVMIDEGEEYYEEEMYADEEEEDQEEEDHRRDIEREIDRIMREEHGDLIGQQQVLLEDVPLPPPPPLQPMELEEEEEVDEGEEEEVEVVETQRKRTKRTLSSDNGTAASNVAAAVAATIHDEHQTSVVAIPSQQSRLKALPVIPYHHSPLYAAYNFHLPNNTLAQPPRLIALPKDYSRLHAMVIAASSSSTNSSSTETSAAGTYDYPALCLVCKSVLNANGKGQCFAHALTCGSGIGVFFLVQDSSILLCHGPRCIYFPSPYVDEFGEHHHHYRGKPLYLDESHYEALRSLWSRHGIATEIVQKRMTANRVIIMGHY